MEKNTIVTNTLLTSTTHYLKQFEPNEVVNADKLTNYLHELDVTAEAEFYRLRRMYTHLLTTNEVLHYYDNQMHQYLENENYIALEDKVKTARHIAQLSDYYSEDTNTLLFDGDELNSKSMQPMTNEELIDVLMNVKVGETNE